jgi:hypothetical protein
VHGSLLLAMIKGCAMKLNNIFLVVGVLYSASAFAKIPPAPPPDPVAAAAKAEKDKATAEKTKADQARYEDKAVANFQANMKIAGKPIPKPTPIVVAVAPVATPVPVAAVPVKDNKSGIVIKK